MRIHALLSWYAEDPAWLREMVASIAPVCDSLVAVDGAYRLTGAEGPSSQAEYDALFDACRSHGVDCVIHELQTPLSEVDKRAFMFARALEVAEPFEDWFLIMDGDQLVRGADPEGLREALDATEHHVAEVMYWHRTGVADYAPLRALFRALPGITVEGAHYVYTAPVDGVKTYLWHTPLSRRRSLGDAPEPALDATALLAIQHRLEDRPPARAKLQQDYYEARERVGLENS